MARGVLLLRITTVISGAPAQWAVGAESAAGDRSAELLPPAAIAGLACLHSCRPPQWDAVRLIAMIHNSYRRPTQLPLDSADECDQRNHLRKGSAGKPAGLSAAPGSLGDEHGPG